MLFTTFTTTSLASRLTPAGVLSPGSVLRQFHSPLGFTHATVPSPCQCLYWLSAMQQCRTTQSVVHVFWSLCLPFVTPAWLLSTQRIGHNQSPLCLGTEHSRQGLTVPDVTICCLQKGLLGWLDSAVLVLKLLECQHSALVWD